MKLLCVLELKCRNEIIKKNQTLVGSMKLTTTFNLQNV